MLSVDLAMTKSWEFFVRNDSKIIIFSDNFWQVFIKLDEYLLWEAYYV